MRRWMITVLMMGCASKSGAPPPVMAETPSPPMDDVESVTKGQAPSDVESPPADAKVTDAGVFYRMLKTGPGGEKPTPDATVTVHYTGWTTDGEQFDSSRDRGEPTTFPLNRVIPGWTDGLQVLAVGDEARFWIPEALAYGGRPGAPAGMLVFDIELLDVANPRKAPRDVGVPTDDAETTENGVRYVRVEGPGGAQPTLADLVAVRLWAWTEDGRSVIPDSKEPKSIGMSALPPELSEALQHFEVGDEGTIWFVPSGNQPETPTGMLTVQAELLAHATPPPLEPPAEHHTTVGQIRYIRTGKEPFQADYPLLPSTRFNYRAWTSEGGLDGNLAAEPADMQGLMMSFPPVGLAVQHLPPGEAGTFWIPLEAGMTEGTELKNTLVFEIERVVD